MSAAQVGGVETIVRGFEAFAPGGDLRHLAYMLATAQHETASTMLPIMERGGYAYLRRMYDIEGERPKLAAANGNTTPGDGARYAGRGYVQLTWKSNYQRAGNKLGVDLVSNPDLALQPDIAARIMFSGMTDGWFTGKRLADYFGAGAANWKHARRIINGLDRADEIASLARSYHKALIVEKRGHGGHAWQ